MDKSRVETSIFSTEKIKFSLKLFSAHFYGHSFIKTVRGPLILFLYNVDTLNICMKEFGSEKIIFDKITAVRT